MIWNRSIGLFLLVLAFGLVGSGCKPAPRKSSAKLKSIPALATPLFDEDAGLMVRTTNIEGGDLLIAQPQTDIIPLGDWQKKLHVAACYKYSAATKKLSLSSAGDWNNATGAISLQRHPESPPTFGLRIENKDYTLKLRQTKIETQGPNAHQICHAPMSDVSAVLSADGKPPIKGMFTGSSGFKGQYYHQLFQRSTGKFIEGSTVKIPFVSRHESIDAFWSADERFIIYVGGRDYRRIAIVHIQPRNQP